MVKENVRGYKKKDGTSVPGYDRKKRPKGKKRKRIKVKPKARYQTVDEYGVFR